MYSFAQRADVRVVDEPLYGHYLRISGAEHPGREEVMAQVNCDGNAVMYELLSEPQGGRSTRLFLKHMAHHLIDLDLAFLSQTCNVLLIRDPREMLPSLTVQLPQANTLFRPSPNIKSTIILALPHLRINKCYLWR